MRTPTRIASFAARKIGPTGVWRGVLRGVDHAAGWTAVRRDVLKAADVDELDELRTASLEKSDLLAQRVELRAMAPGGSGGALFGLAGAPGMAAALPTLLPPPLRTIHIPSSLYGYRWSAPRPAGLAPRR